MNALTWLAIAVLAPGACAIFAWFLHDLRGIVAGTTGADARATPDAGAPRRNGARDA